MSKELSLPTIAELTSDVEMAFKNDQFNLLVNQAPPEKWVKVHPYIKGHLYIPIDKVELMLKKLFKLTKIEITGQGVAFNGVWVTVRLHYLHPVTNEWLFSDGIGASQMQTAKGTSPSDLININNGALAMAMPLAKTLAIKDAAHYIGAIFGANLNRRDVVEFTTDKNLQVDWDEIKELFDLKKESLTEDERKNAERIISNKETPNYRKCLTLLKSK